MGGLEEYDGNTGWKLISGSSLDELMRYEERFPLDLWLRGYKPLILARQTGDDARDCCVSPQYKSDSMPS